MLRLTLNDLIHLKDLATSELLRFRTHSRLPGMRKPLSMEHLRALAWYRATISLLNRHGALKDGWNDATELEVPDSDTEE